MKTIDLKNIIKVKSFVSAFVIFTLLTNLFIFVYVEFYNLSDNAKYNSSLTYETMKSAKEICMSVKQPLGGITFYHDIFYFGYYLIAISTILAILAFIASIVKINLITYKKRTIMLFALAIFLSCILLFGAWTGVDSWFFNCAEMCY